MPWAAGAIPLASPTPSPEELLLQDASLRPEDLPHHFDPGYKRFTTNRQLITVLGQPFEEPSSLSVTLEELDCWGRVLGYDASYSQEAGLSSILEGGTLSLQVTTTLYEDSDGADEAFEFVREQASDPEFVDAFEESFANSPGVEVQDASLTPLSFAELGDERLAFEFKVSAHSTDLDQDFDFIARLVGIRRDRAIGSVTILAVNESPSEDELEDLGRTLDERMNDALE